MCLLVLPWPSPFTWFCLKAFQATIRIVKFAVVINRNPTFSFRMYLNIQTPLDVFRLFWIIFNTKQSWQSTSKCIIQFLGCQLQCRGIIGKGRPQRGHSDKAANVSADPAWRTFKLIKVVCLASSAPGTQMTCFLHSARRTRVAWASFLSHVFFDVFGDTWHYDISWHRLMQRNWSGPVCNPMGAETRLFLFSRRKRVACAFCIFSILSDLIVIWFVWNWCSAELRNSSAIFLSIKFAHRWSSPGALKAPLREVSQRVTCFDDLSVKLLCCSFPTIIVSVFCWFGTGSRWEDRGFSLLLQFLRVGRPFAA